MQIDPIEQQRAESTAQLVPGASAMLVDAAPAPQTTPERIAAALSIAADDLERALALVTNPPRPSFQGHGPADTAAGLLATAGAHLADALSLVASDRASLPTELAEHVAQAIGSTVEAREQLHELLRAGTVAPPQLQPIAVLASTALAHTRAGTAVAIGEP